MPFKDGVTIVSVGFLIDFINNTDRNVTLTAKVADQNDWESSSQANPEVDIKGLELAPYVTTDPIHLERADARASAPFTVTANFSDGSTFEFTLDGHDATNMDVRPIVPVIRGGDLFSVVQVLFHSGENGNPTYNSMTVYLTPYVDTRRWMANYPGHTLTQLNVPGTHDTGTYGGNGESGTRCQFLGIEDQLNAGVRFFDLRLVLNSNANADDLGIFHSDYFQNLWLKKDIMPVVSRFLADHPTECVIFCVNRSGSITGTPKGEPIDTMLHKILMESLPTNKLYDNNATVFSQRTLADLAGCVVLLRQDTPRTFGFDISNWPDDDAYSHTRIGATDFVEMQNAYKYAMEPTWSATYAKKWVNVKKHLERATSPGASMTDWFINFTSASAPVPVADYYPWDFATGGGWGVNYLLARYLVRRTASPAQRFGTIVMDFPEEPDTNTLIRLLLALNK